MSSEAEAREDVWRTLAEFTERERDDPEIAEIEDALDAYRTAIERRVLAQQPCQMCHELPCDGVKHRMFRCCNQKEPRDRCDPCTARQPQETSG